MKYLRVELLGHKVDIYLTEVMPYKSHAIQFIYLKYTTHWFLVYLQSCAAITTISFRTSSFP